MQKSHNPGARPWGSVQLENYRNSEVYVTTENLHRSNLRVVSVSLSGGKRDHRG